LIGENDGREGVHSSTAASLWINALFFALPAIDDSAKRADDAEERPAIDARVALGRTFFVSARSANHRVSFAERLAHGWILFAVRENGGAGFWLEMLNLYHGPHFTTRFAA
jgi:hypothetical protein